LFFKNSEVLLFQLYPDDSLKLNYLVFCHDISNKLADLKSREQFLSNVSHEIRTPLLGIINIVDILQTYRISLDDLIAIFYPADINCVFGLDPCLLQ
jgi:signal transduction histidine kinase